MRRLLITAVALAAAPVLCGQAVYIEPPPALTVSGNPPSGSFPTVLAASGAMVSICSYPSCASLTQTYTDATAGTPCPTNAQAVIAGTSTCTNAADVRGNFGFWVLTGGQYQYTVTLRNGTVYGPFPVTMQTNNAANVQFVTAANLPRTVQDKLGDVVINVKDFGAKCDGSTDDTTAVQDALNSVPSTGGTIAIPAGTCMTSHTLWIKSHTTLIGMGGRSQTSRIKRVNGMYTDLMSAGVYDGLQHAGDYISWYAPLDDGLRYTQSNLGSNIAIKGIYFDGNAANAGQPPAEPNPPLAIYRGSNLVFTFVTGILLDDVWSDNPSNDGAACYFDRHIQIVNAEFSNSHLINPTGNGTRNGLTMAGGFTDELDNNQFTNVFAHDNDNLGVAVQVNNYVGGPSAGGSVTISNLHTWNNKDYGLGLESAGTGFPQLKNFVLHGWVSTNDGWGDSLHLIGLAGTIQGAENVIASGIAFKDEPGGCLFVAGGEQVTISDVTVRGWNQTNTGNIRGCVSAYSTPDWPIINQFTLTNVQITGDGRQAASSAPISLVGIGSLVLSGVMVEGGKYSAIYGNGDGIYISAARISASRIHVTGADKVGLNIAPGHVGFTISDSMFWNNGQAAGAPFRAGLLIGGNSARGSVANSGGFDTAGGSATQQYGFVLTGTGNIVSTVGLWGWGNTSATYSGRLGAAGLARDTGDSVLIGDLPSDGIRALEVLGRARFTAAAGTYRDIALQTGGLTRWNFGANSDAEAGANAGSNFVVQSYDDSGVWQKDVFTWDRKNFWSRPANVTFANLGTPSNNGFFIFCSDCTVGATKDTVCAGAGGGAWAFRSGGNWKCPF